MPVVTAWSTGAEGAEKDDVENERPHEEPVALNDHHVQADEPHQCSEVACLDQPEEVDALSDLSIVGDVCRLFHCLVVPTVHAARRRTCRDARCG